MTGPGHFTRSLEVLLPKGGGVVVMVEGYFDESGDFDEDPKVFCIAGYFIGEQQAREMDAAWGAVLEEHDLPYFHMVDCAHGNGIFKGRKKEECIAVETKLIGLIKKHTYWGFAALTKAEHFKESEKNPDMYSASVDLCITGLYSVLELHNSHHDGIAYFFETGHDNRGKAYKHRWEARKIRRVTNLRCEDASKAASSRRSTGVADDKICEGSAFGRTTATQRLSEPNGAPSFADLREDCWRRRFAVGL